MRPFLVALLLALATPAHGAATVVQCKTSGGSQAACADGSIQTAKLTAAASMPPAPSGAGKLLYDTGSGYAATAACGTAGTMLIGGSPPSCTASGSLSASLTTPLITSASTLTLNAATAPIILGVGGGTTLTLSGTGFSAAFPLAMTNNKITGLPVATLAGDALSYPWITDTSADAELASSPFAIAAGNGSYNDIGLTITLPSAGAYRIWADVRSVINVTTTANAAIELRMYDVTNGAVIAKTERMGVAAATVGVFYQGQVHIEKARFVASGSTAIRVEAMSVTGTVYSTKAIYSDADGRSMIGYEKLSN